MALFLGFVLAGPAAAGMPLGYVECNPEAERCDLYAENRSDPTGPTSLGPASPRSTGTTTDGECTLPSTHKPVRCVDPELGWLGGDGCYYKSALGFVATPALEAKETTPGVAGSWYERSCPGISTGWAVVWKPDAVMEAVLPPSPEVMAQRARSRLVLPAPVLGLSPGVEVVQTVGVPVWLWVEAASWRPVSATAAVPGVSVTATARPVSVVWDFGMGGQVRCAGPGRAFQVGVDDPTAGSECSIAFAHASAGQPQGRFPVTVTVTWQVTWAGAGQTGEAAGLTSQTAASVAVGESQGLVLPGAGR